MDIISTIKKLRKSKGYTHKDMAERLYMARSTYSKLEKKGNAGLNYAMLVNISKVLDVPVHNIVKGGNDPVFTAICGDLEMMLFDARHSIDHSMSERIRFDDLTPTQIAQLREKNLHTREIYEEPPEGGRAYKFGPRDVFRYMMENLGMKVLYERGLIKDEFWLYMWNCYCDEKKMWPNPLPLEIDDREYFIVVQFILKMSGGKEKWVQMAVNDFPDGEGEEGALEYIKLKTGALDGSPACFTYDGYDPVTEIIT
jgi:transcriptional regulator with XRE-family HTH domain